jgi:hypothetical protein
VLTIPAEVIDALSAWRKASNRTSNTADLTEVYGTALRIFRLCILNHLGNDELGLPANEQARLTRDTLDARDTAETCSFTPVSIFTQEDWIHACS